MAHDTLTKLAILLLAFSLPAATAAQAGDATSSRSTPATTHWQLIRDLAALARENGRSDYMLTVARVLARQQVALVERNDTAMVLSGNPAGTPPGVFDARAALAEARLLAKGDADELAEIERFAAQVDKGIVPQTLVYTRDLSVGRPIVMQAQAEGGRIALVRVRSDGDAALRMTVTDETGRVACRTAAARFAAAREDMVCRWTPLRTGAYRIEITNDGPVWTRTIMVSN